MARRDSNNLTFYQYHKIHFSGMTGFPDYHQTNIDKVCQFLDSWAFNAFLQFGEQDKAYDIDYAHGLELDDMFGDPYSIPRNGLDDAQYRFILKCHILAIKSNGTLPELVQFISTVLGCSKNDVALGMARHYLANGKVAGEPDTILINGINIENVSNYQFLPLLASQLQYAVGAAKRVYDVNFYTDLDYPIWTAVGDSFSSSIFLKIPKSVVDYNLDSISSHIGTSNTVSTRIDLNIPRTITNKVNVNDKVNTANSLDALGGMKLNYTSGVTEKEITNLVRYVGVNFNASAKYLFEKKDIQTSPSLKIGVGLCMAAYLSV